MMKVLQLTSILTLISVTALSAHASAILLKTREPVNSTSKAGLAWANGNTVDMEQFYETGKVSWYYTWSVWPADWRRDPEIEFVPQLWGARTVKEFTDRINNTLRTSTPKIQAVLAMNEPELASQSHLEVSDAIELWKTHLEPLRSSYGVRLGSPAVTSGPAGKKWLDDFLTACNGTCNVDFVALHWYGTDADAFIAHLYDYWHAFNRTLWVTEWACHNFVDRNQQCSEDDVVDFMNRTQTFMDNATFVERYAWFGAMKNMQGVDDDNALMDGNGKINDLGRQYVNATSDLSLTGATNSAVLGMDLAFCIVGVITFIQALLLCF